MRFFAQVMSGAALCAALGCASYPKPVESLASAEASLRTAEEEDAKSIPQAALHVQVAQEELTKAQALLKENENEKADLMLMRSRADAELAIALLKESKAQAAVREADEQRRNGDKTLLTAPQPGGKTP